MNREISDKIKFYGFVMTCVIVCYHCPAVGDSLVRGAWDSAGNRILANLIDVFGTIAMSHFFAVTGFLLFRNYSLHSYPEKMKRRVGSLLVPYVLWQCITVGLKLVVNREPVPVLEFVRKTFLFVRFPYNGALWYVYAVFFLALLSPLLLPLFRSKVVAWCGILALIVIAEARDWIALPAFRAVADYGYVDNILRYLPAYLMGCFCGKFCDGDHEKKWILYLVPVVLAALLLERFIPGIFGQAVIKLLPLAALFLLPAVPGLARKKVVELAFLVYAIHQPLVGIMGSALRRIYGVVSLPATVCNLMTWGICLASALCAAWGIRTVLKRFSPKLLACLTGGRA